MINCMKKDYIRSFEKKHKLVDTPKKHKLVLKGSSTNLSPEKGTTARSQQSLKKLPVINE